VVPLLLVMVPVEVRALPLAIVIAAELVRPVLAVRVPLTAIVAPLLLVTAPVSVPKPLISAEAPELVMLPPVPEASKIPPAILTVPELLMTALAAVAFSVWALRLIVPAFVRTVPLPPSVRLSPLLKESVAFASEMVKVLKVSEAFSVTV
jgi:hypothetical protein